MKTKLDPALLADLEDSENHLALRFAQLLREGQYTIKDLIEVSEIVNGYLEVLDAPNKAAAAEATYYAHLAIFSER